MSKKTTVRRSISSTKKFSSNLDCANMANQWVSKAPIFFHIMSVDTNTFTYRRNAESDARYFAPATLSELVCSKTHWNLQAKSFYQQVYFNCCSAYEWFCSPKLPRFSVCLTTEFYRPRRTIPKMSTQTSQFSCKFYQHFGGLPDLRTLKVNSCFYLSPHVRCAVLRKEGL